MRLIGSRVQVGRRSTGMRLAGTSFNWDASNWERLGVTSKWNASSGERLGGASCNWDAPSWDIVQLGRMRLTGSV
ncbi:hypothetical protein BaRGS_00021921 [Batillaria attramentaria]|uniref:Uncharacterized protein n=1 Tax=Batillaria attramentaria TaxID=370345 RepID=A0ABD0KIA6_9CAEN